MTGNEHSEIHRANRLKGPRRRLTLLLVLAAGAVVATPTMAAIRYVDNAGTNTGNCTDPGSPCATISYANSQAVAGDTIDIAAGTYTESTGLTIDRALVLQGAGQASTIIQAHAEPELANRRVIGICAGIIGCPNPDFDVAIADLTIRHGVANIGVTDDSVGGGLYVRFARLTLDNVAFSRNIARGGGGLYVIESGPILTGVTFTDNRANSGGGMFAGTNALPHLDNVVFIGNVADDTTVSTGGGFGGGMYNSGSTPTLAQVTFTANVAEEGGGGMFNVGSSPELANVTFTGNLVTGAGTTSSDFGGGGMGNSSSSAHLTDVDFIDNEVVGNGGGLSNVFNSAAILTNVTFNGNTATRSGGGMSNSGDSSPTLRNVIFSENIAGFGGGGMRLTGNGTLINVAFLNNEASSGGGLVLDEGSATLTNATFGGNSAGSNGGGLNVQTDGSATLFNSIIWGNAAGGGGQEIFLDGTGAGTSVELFYSLYRNRQNDVAGFGDFATENSLTSDPLFADAANDDYRLTQGSPAVDAADPATDLGVFPTDGDGDPIDLDGNPRLIGPAVDMGAYEFEPAPRTLTVTPGSLVFGAVAVGGSAGAQSVTLASVGTEAVAVAAIDAAGAPFARTGGDCPTPPFDLPAGGSCTLAYDFAPTMIGSFDQTIDVTSDAAAVQFSLSGQGIDPQLPPQIDVDPADIAVTVPEGATASRTLSIGNLGEQTLDWAITTAEPAVLPGNGHALAGVTDCESEPGLVSHDDGTIETGFSSIQNAALVDYFEPASYPTVLQAVCIALITESAPSLAFEIFVLDDDGPDGAPGTELGALPVSADDIPTFPPQPPATPTWHRYDISSLAVSIASGGVYIGVRWTQTQDETVLAIDTSPGNPPGFAGGYFRQNDGQPWLPIGNALPSYRSLFVRAVEGEATGCAAPTTVDWLEVLPAAGATAGGDTSQVDVRFDTAGLPQGDHHALLCIDSNDPVNPQITVPVTLTVIEDTTGTLEGTVTSDGYCAADPDPLAGAGVTIIGATGSFVTTTDDDGHYSIAISENESPLTVTARAPGYIDDSESDVGIVFGQTTTVDFDLALDAPCATVQPDSLEVTVEQGDVATAPLTIGNLGGATTLNWTIQTDEAASVPLGAGGMGLLGAEACESGTGVISHDDGTIESGLPSFQGAAFVDYFQPEGYPTALQSVCVALLTEEVTSLAFEIVVLDDDGPGGSPGTQLGALAFSADDIPTFPPQPPATPTWQRYDISPLAVSIASGGVYIGVRWTQMQEEIFLGIDTSPPNPAGFAGGYLQSGPGQPWAPIGDTLPAYRSLFVRAIEATACADPSAIPWLDVFPATGSTAPGQTSPVEVRFNTAGLPVGDHRALLCVDSNDPVNPQHVVPVELTVVAPQATLIVDLGGDGQSTTVGTPFPVPLSVQVRGANNQPVPDITVTFVAPGTGPSATLSSSTVVTDANGYAAVTAIANTVAGAYAVTATVEGVANPVVFDLTNRAVAADVEVTITAHHEYVRPGQTLDYLITLHNAGPDAVTGIDVASTLSDQLDEAFATWLCIGPVGSGCSAQGQGNLVDAGLSLAAGDSVSYLLSAPVRWAAEDVAVTLVDISAAGDPNPANDSDTASSQIVVFRDGFQPYGDGDNAMPLLLSEESFGDAESAMLTLPAPGEALVETLLMARPAGSPNATAESFRIERLNAGETWVRLVGQHELRGDEAGAWMPIAHDTVLALTLADDRGDDGQSIIRIVTLIGPGADRQLLLSAQPARYRLWSAVTMTIER